MKITQELATRAFTARNGTCGYYWCEEDVKRIQDVLREKLGIFISQSEGIDFWRWRSSEWDSSFLSVGSDDEILEWFPKFIKFTGVDTEEDSPEYSPPTLAISGTITPYPSTLGVKVVVKDGDGALWEVELDPEYHTQLLGDIESQIPEESEGGTIRYSLEYDPGKIWGMRKLES